MAVTVGCTHVNLRMFFMLFKSLAKTTVAPASSTLAKRDTKQTSTSECGEQYNKDKIAAS